MTLAAVSQSFGGDCRLALDEWLQQQGRPSVARMVRRLSRYSTSSAVINMHVTLSDGTKLRLVYKRTDADAFLPPARGVKPDFLHDPGREIWMYRDLLRDDRQIDAPVLYGSGITAGDGHWLLIERAQGVELFQVGDRKVWCEVASWLALMHCRSVDKLALMETGSPVRWNAAAFHLNWAERAKRFQDRPGRRDAAMAYTLRKLWRRYGEVADFVAGLPSHMVHGDFNASNIIVDRASGAVRVRPIDWEMAGIGPGLLDLASLVSGGWSDRERDAMQRAYRAASRCPELASMTDDAFAVALDHCRLANAVQWLGWSGSWSPPPEHAHGWAEEAVILAQRLGLVD